jgi:hypothetical protein
MTFISVPALWVGRVLAIGLLGCAPWNYGMVLWQSQVVLLPWCAALLLLGLAAAPVSGVRLGRLLTSPATLGLVLLVLLAALQTTMLPEGIWQAMAAGAKWERAGNALAAEIVPDLPSGRQPLIEIQSTYVPSGAGGGIQFPRTLSIHPLQTQASLSVLAAAVAFFLAAGCLFSRQTGSLMLLLAIACSSTAFTTWGLIDRFVGESSNPRGFSTLVSPNSAPQLLAVGFGAILGILNWWATRRRHRELAAGYSTTYPSVNSIARLRRRVDLLLAELDIWTALMAVALAAHFVAVVAAASRGGMLGFFTAVAAVALVSVLPTARAGKPGVGGGVAILGVLLLAAVTISSLGLGEVASAELGTLNKEAHARDNIRLDIWKWSLSEPAYWLWGAGLGTYHFAIVPCYEQIGGIWFYHAENIYLEAFTEFGLGGLMGLACVLIGLGTRLRTGLVGKGVKNELLWPAMFFATCAVSIQLLVDFSLVIPAIFLPLAALAGAFIGDSGETLFPKRRRRDARTAAVEQWSGHSTERRRDVRQVEKVSAGAAENAKQRQLRVIVGGLAVTGLLILAIFQGKGSLEGFAMAETLERRMRTVKENDWQLEELANLERAFRDQAGRHPEIALQLARLRQRMLPLAIAERAAWPEAAGEEVREQLSSPEVISSINRGGAEGALGTLGPVVKSVRSELENLSETNRVFRRLASTCPLDWRVYWGQLRSNLGQMSVQEVATAYAMLKLSGRHQINTLETAGLTAIFSGETVVGRSLVEQTIAAYPPRAFRMLRHLSLLSKEDLTAVVSDPLMLAQMLERISVGRYDEAVKAAGLEMASELDSSDLFARADSGAKTDGEWTAVSFVAEQQGNLSTAIEAMQRANGKSPFKWNLRYRLAQLLKKDGQLDRAMVEMRQIPEADMVKNVVYGRFMNELKKLLAAQDAD